MKYLAFLMGELVRTFDPSRAIDIPELDRRFESGAEPDEEQIMDSQVAVDARAFLRRVYYCSSVAMHAMHFVWLYWVVSIFVGLAFSIHLPFSSTGVLWSGAILLIVPYYWVDHVRYRLSCLLWALDRSRYVRIARKNKISFRKLLSSESGIFKAWPWQ